MGTVAPEFGNSLILVILEADGTFPTSLSVWNGSAGNILKLDCNVKDVSKSGIQSNTTEYKTNDDNLYAQKNERTYMSTGNLYKRNDVVSNFFEDCLVDAVAAGKKTLEILNLGYVEAKFKESFAIGEVTLQTNEEDNKADASMPYEFKSTPPSSAFSLTTTNVAAINTAVGSGSVKATVAVTIPAASSKKPRKLIFT